MTKRVWGVLVFVAMLAASPCGEAQTLQPAAGGQYVEMSLSGGQIVARPLQASERMSVTVKGPGDYWERHEFAGDSVGAFELGTPGTALQDGSYTFEVRLFDAPRADGREPSLRVASGRFRWEQGSLAETAAEPAATRQPTADLTISDPTPQLIFDDTDAGAIDWQARTNADGATFVIQNSTAAPVTVEATAPTNSLYLSSSGGVGAVGIGTTTPFGNLHVTGNSSVAELLLEPSGGTLWSFTGAPSYLSLGDGHTLVLRPGALGRSFQIDSTGNIAMFADAGSPLAGDVAGATLHVKRGNGTAKLLVQETGTPNVGRNMLQMKNNGAATFRFDNTATGQVWSFGSRNAGDFFIAENPTAAPLELLLSQTGTLTITGTLVQGSDRNSKADIEAVDPQAMLRKVAELPISTWRYKEETAKHVGPMAQDFAGAFGLGADDTHIAPGDMAGLALAAIQDLVRQNQDLRGELAELRQRVVAVEGQR